MGRKKFWERVNVHDFVNLLEQWQDRLTEGHRKPESVWGVIASTLSIKNDARTRKLLYMTWKQNGQNVNNQVASTSHEGAEPVDEGSTSPGSDQLFCICRQPNDPSRPYVGCDVCNNWFHFDCVGYEETAKTKHLDYICPLCVEVSRQRRRGHEKVTDPADGGGGRHKDRRNDDDSSSVGSNRVVVDAEYDEGGDEAESVITSQQSDHTIDNDSNELRDGARGYEDRVRDGVNKKQKDRRHRGSDEHYDDGRSGNDISDLHEDDDDTSSSDTRDGRHHHQASADSDNSADIEQRASSSDDGNDDRHIFSDANVRTSRRKRSGNDDNDEDGGGSIHTASDIYSTEEDDEDGDGSKDTDDDGEEEASGNDDSRNDSHIFSKADVGTDHREKGYNGDSDHEDDGSNQTTSDSNPDENDDEDDNGSSDSDDDRGSENDKTENDGISRDENRYTEDDNGDGYDRPDDDNVDRHDSQHTEYVASSIDDGSNVGDVFSDTDGQTDDPDKAGYDDDNGGDDDDDDGDVGGSIHTASDLHPDEDDHEDDDNSSDSDDSDDRSTEDRSETDRTGNGGHPEDDGRDIDDDSEDRNSQPDTGNVDRHNDRRTEYVASSDDGGSDDSHVFSKADVRTNGRKKVKNDDDVDKDDDGGGGSIHTASDNYSTGEDDEDDDGSTDTDDDGEEEGETDETGNGGIFGDDDRNMEYDNESNRHDDNYVNRHDARRRGEEASSNGDGSNSSHVFPKADGKTDDTNRGDESDEYDMSRHAKHRPKRPTHEDNDAENDSNSTCKSPHTSSSEDEGSIRSVRKEERAFSFQITRNEWLAVSPKPGTQKLRKGWTDLLAGKFFNRNKTCVLTFKNQHVRKTNSRKARSSYWNASAACKFSGCCQYAFEINNRPTKGSKTVTIRVKRLGPIRHGKSETKKRPTTGKQRTRIAAELEEEGSSSWYYGKMFQMDPASRAAGNLNDPKTLGVLHKIISNERKKQNLADDVIGEIALLKQLYAEIDTDSTVPGFIEFFGRDPFEVVLLKEDMLHLFAEAEEGVLYLDATSSIVQKIPGIDKPVFYYALVMKSPLPKKGAVAVAEFLTTDQQTSEVCHFLMRVMNCFRKARHKEMMPRRIEIDNSWVLLNAVLNACNKDDARTYLRDCWNIVNGIAVIKSKVYPHMCSAHMMHQMSRILKSIGTPKKISKFAMYAFALMVECTTLAEATAVFQHICRVFGSQKRTPDFLASEVILGELINEGTTDLTEQAAPPNPALDENMERPNTTIKKSSPFFHHFNGLWEDVKDGELKQISTAEENTMYKPDVIDVLIPRLMHLYPLWSGLMLGNLNRHAGEGDQPNPKHHTNNLVENFFGQVKKDTLPKRGRRLRPGRFIRSRYVSTLGHINEIRAYQPSAFKRTRKQRTTRAKKGTEEVWKRKRKQRKSKYFTRPNTRDEGKETNGMNRTHKNESDFPAESSADRPKMTTGKRRREFTPSGREQKRRKPGKRATRQTEDLGRGGTERDGNKQPQADERTGTSASHKPPNFPEGSGEAASRSTSKSKERPREASGRERDPKRRDDSHVFSKADVRTNGRKKVKNDDDVDKDDDDGGGSIHTASDNYSTGEDDEDDDGSKDTDDDGEEEGETDETGNGGISGDDDRYKNESDFPAESSANRPKMTTGKRRREFTPSGREQKRRRPGKRASRQTEDLGREGTERDDNRQPQADERTGTSASHNPPNFPEGSGEAASRSTGKSRERPREASGRERDPKRREQPKRGKRASGPEKGNEKTSDTKRGRTDPSRPHTQDNFDVPGVPPRWGGNTLHEGVRVYLANTCPIDNLLYIFYRMSTERPDIYRIICDNQDILVCEYFSSLSALGAIGEWTKAKVLWLTDFCNFPVRSGATKDNWNVYGSEYGRVVCYLGGIQASQQASTWSENTCSRGDRQIYTNDISLSASNNSEGVQDMMNRFMNGSVSLCNHSRPRPSTEKCRGIRTWEPRKFVNFDGKPPLLVFSPTYFVGAILHTASFADQEELSVGDMRYELFAVTVNENDHFKAAFKTDHGWRWYDGMTASLSGFHRKFDAGGGIPEHVIYVRII